MLRKVLLLIDFSEEYGRGLLNGIAKYSSLFGPWNFCRLPLIFRNKDDVRSIIEWAKGWEPDGIIAQIESEDVFRQLKQLNKPLIAQDAKERFSDIPNISGYYYKTGEMAATYLKNKGFCNFAFYGFEDIVWSRERCEGFTDRIEQVGGKVYVYQHTMDGKPPLWSYKESNLSDWLKSLPKPIAIFCCDDNQGRHVTEACAAVGYSVPEQVAVLGVDNDTSICGLSDPPLSSISLNTEKAGFEAAMLLDKLMQNSCFEWEDIYVEPLSIIPRRSTDFFAVEDKEIGKALHFIYRNFREGIRVDDVVNATALSRRVLEKRFQKVLKRTVLEEVNSLRIEHVKQMLAETDMSITDIAIGCGYADVKNMSRFFRNFENVTPLAYRKKTKK